MVTCNFENSLPILSPHTNNTKKELLHALIALANDPLPCKTAYSVTYSSSKLRNNMKKFIVCFVAAGMFNITATMNQNRRRPAEKKQKKMKKRNLRKPPRHQLSTCLILLTIPRSL
jgi:hypothetical protein